MKFFKLFNILMACSPLKCPFLSLRVSNLPPCDLQKLKKLKNLQIFQKFYERIKTFASVPRTHNLNFTRIRLLVIVLHAFKQRTGLYNTRIIFGHFEILVSKPNIQEGSYRLNMKSLRCCTGDLSAFNF